MENFSELSRILTQQLSKYVKKSEGIYFTPPIFIQYILSLIQEYCHNINFILEPSCGSGEFITALRNKFPNCQITGIEQNETIFQAIHPTLSSEKTSIIHHNYLNYQTSTVYDLIIGNPPFGVFKKSDIDPIYYPYFTGRPNIFIPFIIKSINMLQKNGLLCFVLPKNFLNCLYYNKTREFITQTCDLLHISSCNGKYLETQQDTIVMLLRKHKSDYKSKHILNVSNFTIFTIEDNTIFNSFYENSNSLHSLGFKVSVGSVVWNQCKNILTDDSSKTLLVYSSDFEQNKLSPKTYKNKDKKNYIDLTGKTEPVLVINRGYGKGSYSFNHCIIDVDYPYLLENHVIGITYIGTKSRSELIEMYQNIVKSLNDQKTKQFIASYFGNEMINTTELNHILPIYL